MPSPSVSTEMVVEWVGSVTRTLVSSVAKSEKWGRAVADDILLLEVRLFILSRSKQQTTLGFDFMA